MYIERLQILLTEADIKNHVKVMKEEFGVVYDIFKGYCRFSWSPLTKKSVAADDV